jgi:hypothetical protein
VPTPTRKPASTKPTQPVWNWIIGNAANSFQNKGANSRPPETTPSPPAITTPLEYAAEQSANSRNTAIGENKQTGRQPNQRAPDRADQELKLSQSMLISRLPHKIVGKGY